MRVEALSAQNVARSDARHERLTRAAQEFEAQLMKELLDPLTSEAFGGDDDDGSGSALTQFASEALGRSISAQGGFGIATSMIRSISRNETFGQGLATSEPAQTSPAKSGAISLKSQSALPIMSVGRSAHGNPK